jgi:hypothetical protein
MFRIVPCLIVVVALLLGMLGGATGVNALTLDQSLTGPGTLGASINDCCRFAAQTFTAGLTGTLEGVNIDIQSSSTFPLHVAIRTVEGGAPSTTILGETTLSSGSAPLSLLITFPQVIRIEAGVQYAIVVNYEGAPPPAPDQTQGVWGGETGDQYTGGAGYLSFQDGISWFGGGDGDLHFQTYMGPAIIPVAIDIKPGSSPNAINPKSNGVIPVAILTTDTFDATTVDPLTVEFGPGGATEAHGRGHIEDVNHDGEPDLVFHFRTQETGIQCGDTSASLTGETFDGDAIEGTDVIKTVECNK